MYETATQAGSACRRSAARRTTWSCCRTPTSISRPMRRSAPPTDRRAALHGGVGGRRGGEPATRWCRGCATGCAPDGRRRATRPGPKWGRSSRASTARASCRTWSQGVPTAPSWWWTGARPKVPGHEGASSSGPCLFDRVTPDGHLHGRDLRSGPRRRARGSYEEALALVNASPYANGVAVFTNDGGAARRFQHEVQVGMVGINVPIPVPMAYYSFGAGRQSLFGDAHVHGREGVHFYTRGPGRGGGGGGGSAHTIEARFSSAPPMSKAMTTLRAVPVAVPVEVSSNRPLHPAVSRACAPAAPSRPCSRATGCRDTA